MSEYMFGGGKGWLPEKANTIARKHGAELCNYADPGCRCGYGCGPHDDCPENKRHWFAVINRGEPFNSTTERAVMGALRAAGIIR